MPRAWHPGLRVSGQGVGLEGSALESEVSGCLVTSCLLFLRTEGPWGPNASALSCSQEIPVNVRFCLEGMEESGSEGLDELIFARKDTFFKDVDYVCISDNYWLGKKKPCITYGLRGICYFFIEVLRRVLCCVLRRVLHGL